MKTRQVRMVQLLAPVLLAGMLILSVESSGAAGLFDQLGETAKKIGSEIADGAGKVGEEISEGARKIGEDVGVVDKKAAAPPSAKPDHGSAAPAVQPATAGKLPGGISSRLTKITAELDKAEQAYSANGNTPSNRTYVPLQKARVLKDEIDKNYAGQFSESHPEIAVVFERLNRLQAMMDESTETSATASATATTKATNKTGELSCEQWNTKFQVFTQGDRALHSYPTDDAAQMERWKAAYDESTALLADYRASSMNQETCPWAEGTIRQLSNYRETFAGIYATYQQDNAKAAASRGEFVFASAPIDPAAPKDLTDRFRAGDHIYGLIRTTMPWSAIYENDQEAQVRVDVTLDGKQIHAQFITVRDPQLLAGNHLLFDIAPDPSKMNAYATPGIEFGKSSATMRQGPNELTHHLGGLTAGTHELQFTIQYYGTTYASGGFTIDGDDFGPYAALHETIAG
ncbi:MAG: hypothetical protein IH612_17015, partial [Desulfofustis sp.]|nr:hypothetical protein [Desulfofustis sp.]